MIIRREHSLPVKIVRQRIESAISSALDSPPGGATVVETAKSWSNDVMSFRVKARRRILGLSKTVIISGTVAVTAEHVTVTLAIPTIVKAVIGESRVRALFDREFNHHVSRGGHGSTD